MTFTCTCGASKSTHADDEQPESKREQACVCFEDVSLHERLAETQSVHQLGEALEP